jgi:hypothetical protein
MANVVIAPADLKVNSTNGQLKAGEADVALATGDWVYRTATGGYNLARANSAATASVAGVAVNNAIVGGVVYINETDPIIAGAVFTADAIYVLSAATAGRIAPLADLVAGNIIVLVGVGSSSTGMSMAIKNTGIVKS